MDCSQQFLFYFERHLVLFIEYILKKYLTKFLFIIYSSNFSSIFVKGTMGASFEVTSFFT
jgi:hypothetical protein